MKKIKKIKHKNKSNLLDNIKAKPLKISENETNIKNDMEKFKNIFKHKWKCILIFIILIQLIINVYLFIKQRRNPSNNFKINIKNVEQKIDEEKYDEENIDKGC